MKKLATTVAVAALSMVAAVGALADGTYQSLPFANNWSAIGAITVNDDWSGVAGITGYLGDSDPLAAVTNVDPRTLTADIPTVAVDVIANQLNPATNISGGVGEFEITDPTIALQGSGTADAPYILLFLNTSGKQNINVAYAIRDIDSAIDNSVQQCNAQYRVGASGPWTNITGTYVADASTGPSLATLVTPISALLPSACDNQAQVQVRIMTTNASGSDEWLGIDNINVTGENVPVPTKKNSWGMVKSLYR